MSGKQSRWGAPLQTAASSAPATGMSSSSASPVAASSSAAGLLPTEQQHQSEVTSKYKYHHHTTPSYENNDNISQHHHQQQHQGRGYEMNNNHEREDYNRARSSSTGNGGGGAVNDGERGYHSRGGGNSRRKYSYDDDMSSRRGDWKCMECGLYNDARDDYCHRCNRNNNNYYERDDDHKDTEDWRCMECGMWNHPRDYKCHRCEKNQASEFHSRKKKRRKDGVGGGGGDEHQQSNQHHDEYKQLREQFKKRQKMQRDREWPPSFDTEGASFIFDSRSGMFFHPPSDFFYDPKTKLYYSNKKGQYFRFVGSVGGDVGEDAPIPFLPVGPGGGGGGNAAAATGGESAAERPIGSESEPKSKIAISLKTKVLAANSTAKSLHEAASIEKTKLKEQNMAARSKDSSLQDAPTVHKKHEEDMTKWSGRAKEFHDENPDPSSTPRKIQTTSKGQPICLICRRKFPTVEKLEQHEKLSALHKENLAKKAVADAAKSSNKKEESTSYRDRSKQRRMMYGDDLTSSHSSGPSSRAEAILAQVDGSRGAATSGASEKTTETVRPEDTLGDTNVGNKLLQKLGWKSGDALGRKQDDGENNNEGRKDDVASSLKSDWERIESLAQGGGGRR